PERAAERRPDLFLGDRRPERGDGGLRLLQLAFRAVEVLLGRQRTPDELLRAPDVEPGELHLRDASRQLRLLDRVVELDEHLARLDGVTGLEQDLLDRARDLVAEIDAAHGAQPADGADL